MTGLTNTDIGKRRMRNFAIVFCGIIAAGTGTSASAGSGTEKHVTHTPVSELEWKVLPNGRELSPVAGDIKKGPHTTYVKFAPGMKTAPHTHSNDYYGIVVKGTARHFEPGTPESKVVLPAGSHWAVPANVVHVSECLPGSECIFAISQKSYFDIKPVE